MAYGETYEQFVGKFKLKRTTDDCYTPVEVYNTVADFVANNYGLNKENFVRPFYPGGDYENYEYSENSVVVDNPPFSIISKILRFYAERDIKFFLFAPQLTVLHTLGHSENNRLQIVTVIPGMGDIVYENGAVVNTSFVTNLEVENYAIRTYPAFIEKLKEVNKKEQKKQKKQVAKYEYPPNVLTSGTLAKFGCVDLKIKHDECFKVNALDSQKESKKALYGSGFLLSARATAEKQLAEKQLAEKRLAIRWELSDRELEIIKELDEKAK